MLNFSLNNLNKKNLECFQQTKQKPTTYNVKIWQLVVAKATNVLKLLMKNTCHS
jgi:hypothetical protein